MINFSNTAISDLSYWIEKDRKIALRIIRIIEKIKRNPFVRIGKPETLTNDFKGYWSRRIDDEHRLIYRMEEGILFIHSCRFHYL
jgi:toxin YoeB